MTRLDRFKANCKRYLEIGEITAPLEKEKKALKKEIDSYTNGECVTEGKYMVNYNDVKGAIDLDALIAEHPEIDLERYRKAPTKRIQVKIAEV